MKKKDLSPVQDYWKFMRELKAQLNLIKVLERQFFELDDLCEWSIRNDVTVLDEKTGERVSVVDKCLSEQQAGVYDSLRIEVGNLYDMLSKGRCCFEIKTRVSDERSEQVYQEEPHQGGGEVQ